MNTSLDEQIEKVTREIDDIKKMIALHKTRDYPTPEHSTQDWEVLLRQKRHERIMLKAQKRGRTQDELSEIRMLQIIRESYT